MVNEIKIEQTSQIIGRQSSASPAPGQESGSQKHSKGGHGQWAGSNGHGNGSSAGPEGSGAAVKSEAGPSVKPDASVKCSVVEVRNAEGDVLAVKIPLDVSTMVDCRWRDGVYHRARVIERRPKKGSDEYDYYVHYSKLNRRMDEWVTLDSFDLSSVDTSETDAGGLDANGRTTRGQKRKVDEAHEDEHHGEFDANQLREHEEFTKVKNVERIELGKFEMETWYYSPLPAEYNDCKTLYFSEFDLMFFKERNQMLRHLRKCRLLHPPGDEIYRNGRVSMFEVDGKKEKIYCQNLCYLAKLFLDHKTLYYDVDLFLFYVLCEWDERGAHIVGYFSKEKMSEEGYNLACILCFPSYQRKGYGKFLIAMSYELSKIEGKVGTPERPLSDLGLVSYRGYWTRILLNVLQEHDGTISIKELSDLTAIKTDDIISTLQFLNLIQYQKGQHVLLAAPKVIERHLKEAGAPGLHVDPSKIVWTPYNAELVNQMVAARSRRAAAGPRAE